MNTAIAPPPQDVVEADVARALAEDVGNGDVTAMLLPDHEDIAYLLCKEPAVVCGRPWFDACHRMLDPDVAIDWRVAEGDRVEAGTVRSEEHTSELQSLMRISYAVLCLQKKTSNHTTTTL